MDGQTMAALIMTGFNQSNPSLMIIDSRLMNVRRFRLFRYLLHPILVTSYYHTTRATCNPAWKLIRSVFRPGFPIQGYQSIFPCPVWRRMV